MGVNKAGGVRVGGVRVGTPSERGAAPDWYGKVDFDRDAFTAAIKDKGYDVTWEKATFCPNRGGPSSPRDHKINCKICDGSGQLYFGSEDTRMLMTSINLSQGYYAYGRWDSGTQMVTALPEFRLHPYDRLTLRNGVARFTEIVKRQPATLIDQLKYAALGIDYLSWVNRDGELQAFGEDDYSLVDGRLVWASQTVRPDDNTLFTVAYTYHPRYVVTELVHQHRESTIDGVHYEFPVQAIAKLDFLVRDESTDASDQVEDQNPFPRDPRRS